MREPSFASFAERLRSKTENTGRGKRLLFSVKQTPKKFRLMPPFPASLRPALHLMASNPTVTPWRTATDREMNFSECVLIPLSLIPSTRHRCSLKRWMECVARARDWLCVAHCSFRSHQKRLTTSWLLMPVLLQSVGSLLIRKSAPFFWFLLTALCFRSGS